MWELYDKGFDMTREEILEFTIEAPKHLKKDMVSFSYTIFCGIVTFCYIAVYRKNIYKFSELLGHIFTRM